MGLYVLSVMPARAIPTPSVCGVWHCRLYILLRFWFFFNFLLLFLVHTLHDFSCFYTAIAASSFNNNNEEVYVPAYYIYHVFY